MRFILLVLVLIAAVWLVRRALLRIGRPDGSARAPAAPGELVSCARCGLLLPRTEAREAGDALFCSDEHARLGAGSKG